MNNGVMPAQASNIFWEAAAYIREYGWQISGMGRHGQPRCSMGALASAHQAKVWDKKLSEFMYERLQAELNGIGLTEFNYKYRSGEKVARLFESVAASCKTASHQI